MTSNTSKLFKIAQLLDQKGKYALSDKVDNLIKTSQNMLPTLPGNYEVTGPPLTGNPLIDSMWQNMSDTAAGSGFAGGGMYDKNAPFRSKYGPEGPGLLPTLTPAQFAELSKTESGRKYLAQMQLSGGLKAQEYSNLTNPLIFLRKDFEQNLAPGVAQERKQAYLGTLSGTMSAQISNILTRRPIYQWQPMLNEFYTLANEFPEHSSQIKNMINSSVKSALDNLKYHDASNYERIVKDPKYKDFANKYGV